jgi:tetratricopeptide (TPR) repeat protein
MPKAKVFISYSHRDVGWLKSLSKHLDGLAGEELIDPWDDRRIHAGDDWRAQIQDAVDTCDVAVLLVSADFLTSKFIRGEELPPLLERRKTGGLAVFPLILRPCVWKHVEQISTIQARPRDGRTLFEMRGGVRERELVAAAEEILLLARSRERTPAKLTTTCRPEPDQRRKGGTIPRQLPSPPADFVGREDELSELERLVRESARQGDAAIVGLQGLGGVGKSALARILAKRVVDIYPDGQVNLDLKGTRVSPLLVTEAMTRLIHAFRPGVLPPADSEEIEGDYRTILNGQRALLLLDDASGPDQVEPLIPPPANLLLVTSRTIFNLPGMVPRLLDSLPQDQAEQLLLSIAPRIGKETRGISELCGRLPLALRLAANMLVEDPGLTVTALRRQLQRAKKQDQVAELVLGVTYRRQSKRLQAAFRFLGVFPSVFDAEAASSVWKCPLEEAEATLGALTRRCLVEGNDGKYRLHDLARAYAKNRSSQQGTGIARLRHAEHYLRLLWELRERYLIGGVGLQESLSGFDREWPNLRAAWDFAENNNLQNKAIDRICTDLPRAATHFLDLRLHPREHIRWLKKALDSARRLEDRSNESHHLNCLGLCYVDLGDHRGAIEVYQECLVLARAMEDRRSEGLTLGNLGSAYAAIGDRETASVHFAQDLEIARELGDRRGEANALGGLGLNYLDLEQLDRGLKFCEQSLAIKRELGDQRGEAKLLGGLGFAYSRLNQPDRAIEVFEKQLGIARDILDHRGVATTSWNLGEIYEASGKLETAATLMQVLVDYETEVGLEEVGKSAAHVEALRARIRKFDG